MPRALADLEALGARTPETPGYAKLLARRLLDASQRLEAFPRSGRVVPEIGDDAVREVVYRGYRVVYVVTADDSEVDVLTVFHSSRPLEGLGG